MERKTACIEKLKQYDAMCQAVQNLQAEMERLEILGGFTCAAELEKARRSAVLWCEQVDRALQVLSPEEKLILSRLYMYPRRRNIDRLCTELGCEQSSVYRRRDKALGKFCMALRGIEN